MQCPVCKKNYANAAGFSQHAKAHVRRGELVRKEVVRPEVGNQSHGYAWCNTAVYVKTSKTRSR